MEDTEYELGVVARRDGSENPEETLFGRPMCSDKRFHLKFFSELNTNIARFAKEQSYTDT